MKDLNLLISKKSAGIFINTESTLPVFEDEEELVRHIFQEYGEGLYIIQYICKGRQGVSEAIWRGYIRPAGDGNISYMNKIDSKILENLTRIDQKRPGDRHIIHS